MKTITKGLVGTVAAGAVAMASVSPAYARNGHDDRVDAGDVIAGALIIGGIAALAAAASDNDRDRYDRRYDDRRGYDDRYYGDRRGSPRSAVEQCVNAAERQASRYSRGGRADVTDIRDISRTRDGYRIKGRIAVNTRSHDWRRGDSRYGNGWGGDYRGWNDRLSGYDSGKFTCRVKYGRVVDVDYSGIRGL
ncbi:MAG: hypothetical protein BGO57_10035 [Sphingomonadales bacterium 63-6]|nr:MAG: hypothetical protein BGO57_10035 [Sphingomonadales bacterium 63-6]